MPATYTETVGATAGMQAQMSFNLTKGATVSALPNFFNASGSIIAPLLANANPTLDFTPFNKGGTVNITFTATTFTGGINSFAGLFATAGSTITGTGSFSQAALVPEPASVALVGVGMSGLIAFRRLFRKRPKVG
jgi:hypothetical protein